MNRLQFAALVLALTSAAGGASGGLLPGDANTGYQYDRPAFGGDFGRRTGDSRFPGGPSTAYGTPTTGGFSNFGRQGAGFGFGGRQPGYQGYQGNLGYQRYQGNDLGYQGNGQGYQGFQGNTGAYQGFQRDNNGGYQGYDTGDRSAPRPYSFEYEVRDAPSGNDYGQQESGDGNGAVRGEYRVLLPDSRTQIVRYTADDANGYVADVRYEGQAQFPRPGGTAFGQGNTGFFGNGFQPGRGNVGYNGVASAGNGFGGGGTGGGGYADSNQYLPPSAGSYGK